MRRVRQFCINGYIKEFIESDISNISTIEEFKDAILEEKSRFTKAFSGHLLSFALGRKLSAVDSPALEAIADEAKKKDYRFQPLLKSIILSEPFLYEPN